MKSFPQTRRCAFTLVELLLVLVIIGVFAGMAVVSLQGRRGDRAVRSSADDLCAAVRYAATTADARGVPHRVAFDTSMTTFQVEAWDAEKGEFAPANGLVGRPRHLPERVRVSRVVPAETIDGAARNSSPAADGADATAIEFGTDNAFSGFIEVVADSGESARVQVSGQSRQAYVER